MSTQADTLRRADTFLSTRGRPLERALWRHLAHGAPAEDALTELARFQNADGGFGNALEPDLRTAASSAIATSIGLRRLHELGADAEHPVVRGAMAWLAAAWEPALDAWPIIPPAVEDAPHAPWWGWDDTLAERWRGFAANPRAELLGYLYTWSDLAPPGLIDHLSQAVPAWLEGTSGELEMHDLICLVTLVETPATPDALRQRLLPRLREAVHASVTTDPSAWEGYGLKPLDLISAPTSPFAAELADAIEANLDWLLTRTDAEGAWAPSWSWFGTFEDTWPKAAEDWRSVLTLRNLLAFRAFGRYTPG